MSFFRKMAGPVAALVLLTLSGFSQVELNRMAENEAITRRIIYRPADIVSNVIVAGFRGIAADLLWVQIDELFHKGQHYRILPVFEMVTFLQPHFMLAWSVGGWHMAFNLYHQAPTKDQKERWLEMGLDFLKKGARSNPEHFDLFFDIGWTYFMKTEDYAACIHYFAEAAKRDHPQWVDHMLAHSYEKAGRYRDAYKVWRGLQIRGSMHPSFERIVDRFVKRLAEKIGEEEEPEKRGAGESG